MSRLALRAEAHAVAVLIRLALRLLPLPRIAALLARLPRTRRDASASDCVSAAAVAARNAAHPTCLYVSLTAFALLARRAYAPRFVIGAAHDPEFDAHAWVTIGGVPVIPCVREYVPLWTSGPGAAGTS